MSHIPFGVPYLPYGSDEGIASRLLTFDLIGKCIDYSELFRGESIKIKDLKGK